MVAEGEFPGGEEPPCFALPLGNRKLNTTQQVVGDRLLCRNAELQGPMCEHLRLAWEVVGGDDRKREGVGGALLKTEALTKPLS